LPSSPVRRQKSAFKTPNHRIGSGALSQSGAGLPSCITADHERVWELPNLRDIAP
jgi:hypothetical protein